MAASVQVQHPGLRDSFAADAFTVETLVAIASWLFPDFNYWWLVEEVRDTLPLVRPACLTRQPDGQLWQQLHLSVVAVLCLCSDALCCFLIAQLATCMPEHNCKQCMARCACAQRWRGSAGMTSACSKGQLSRHTDC